MGDWDWAKDVTEVSEESKLEREMDGLHLTFLSFLTEELSFSITKILRCITQQQQSDSATWLHHF